MRAQRGSTLVESSVVLLTFLVILIMLMDAGQILFFHQFLSDRARAGARYAVVHTFNAATVKNVVVYENVSSSGMPGLFGMSTSMVSVTRYDSGTANDRVLVRVSGFKMRFLTPWLAGIFTPGPFSAVMPMESAGTAQ